MVVVVGFDRETTIQIPLALLNMKTTTWKNSVSKRAASLRRLDIFSTVGKKKKKEIFVKE